MDPSYQGRIPQVPYSTRQNSRFRLSRRGVFIILFVIIALIVGGVLLSQSGDKTVPLQQRLTARLTTLQKMTDEGEKNIKGGDLREFNARLRIQLSSDIKTISDAVSDKKVDKVITADEADTASFSTLKDAQLNSRFDTAYNKLISQKLDSTTLLMKELYDKTPSRKLKSALDSSYRNFKQLQNQLEPAAS